jgi:hypothetical protein
MKELLPTPERLQDIIKQLNSTYQAAPIEAHDNNHTNHHFEELAIKTAAIYLGYHFLINLNNTLTPQYRSLLAGRSIEIAEKNYHQITQGLYPHEEKPIVINDETSLSRFIVAGLQKTAQTFAANAELLGSTNPQAAKRNIQNAYLSSFCGNFISTAQRDGSITTEVIKQTLISAQQDSTVPLDPMIKAHMNMLCHHFSVS